MHINSFKCSGWIQQAVHTAEKWVSKLDDRDVVNCNVRAKDEHKLIDLQNGKCESKLQNGKSWSFSRVDVRYEYSVSTQLHEKFRHAQSYVQDAKMLTAIITYIKL